MGRIGLDTWNMGDGFGKFACLEKASFVESFVEVLDERRGLTRAGREIEDGQRLAEENPESDIMMFAT